MVCVCGVGVCVCVGRVNDGLTLSREKLYPGSLSIRRVFYMSAPSGGGGWEAEIQKAAQGQR